MPKARFSKPERRSILVLGGSIGAVMLAVAVYCSARTATRGVSEHARHLAALRATPGQSAPAEEGRGGSRSAEDVRGDDDPSSAPGAESTIPPPADRSLGVYPLPLLEAADASAPAATAVAPDASAAADAAAADTPAADAGASADAALEPDPDESLEPAQDPPLEGLELGLTQCGLATCNPGFECCCDVCVLRSEGCNDPNCPASSSLSLSVPCGMQLCDPGEICCDARCGACGTAGECPESPCE